jgi:sugar/nucleoside kinase (ribokinase family)
VPTAAVNSRIVFLGNLDPAIQEKALNAFQTPELVILDSMNFWILNHSHALKAAIQRCNLLILNDQEIRALTQSADLISAMKKVLEWGPERVIVKKGEHGAAMLSSEGYFACPAVPVDKVVDPTGAGDSFAGGLSGFLASQPEWTEPVFRQAVVIGTLVASNTVQGFSVDALEALTLEKIQQGYAQYYQQCEIPIFP